MDLSFLDGVDLSTPYKELTSEILSKAGTSDSQTSDPERIQAMSPELRTSPDGTAVNHNLSPVFEDGNLLGIGDLHSTQEDDLYQFKDTLSGFGDLEDPFNDAGFDKTNGATYLDDHNNSSAHLGYKKVFSNAIGNSNNLKDPVYNTGNFKTNDASYMTNNFQNVARSTVGPVKDLQDPIIAIGKRILDNARNQVNQIPRENTSSRSNPNTSHFSNHGTHYGLQTPGPMANGSYINGNSSGLGASNGGFIGTESHSSKHVAPGGIGYPQYTFEHTASDHNVHAGGVWSHLPGAINHRFGVHGQQNYGYGQAHPASFMGSPIFASDKLSSSRGGNRYLQAQNPALTGTVAIGHMRDVPPGSKGCHANPLASTDYFASLVKRAGELAEIDPEDQLLLEQFIYEKNIGAKGKYKATSIATEDVTSDRNDEELVNDETSAGPSDHAEETIEGGEQDELSDDEESEEEETVTVPRPILPPTRTGRVRIAATVHIGSRIYPQKEFPAHDYPVPPNTSLFDICQKYPQSIEGDILKDFLRQEWTGCKIFKYLNYKYKCFLIKRISSSKNNANVFNKRLLVKKNKMKDARIWDAWMNTVPLRQDGIPSNWSQPALPLNADDVDANTADGVDNEAASPKRKLLPAPEAADDVDDADAPVVKKAKMTGVAAPADATEDDAADVDATEAVTADDTTATGEDINTTDADAQEDNTAEDDTAQEDVADGNVTEVNAAGVNDAGIVDLEAADPVATDVHAAEATAAEVEAIEV